jgi:16S rRNA (adenine1518-N6/adenine1519-N6)-dimethyltransferase
MKTKSRSKRRPSVHTKKRGARLGQHFLTAQWVAHTLAESARITNTDTVLEIGPGTGNLTKELLRRGARVVAVEKDPALVTTLMARFSEEIEAGRLVVVAGDIRDHETLSLNLRAGGYILAANIPYYITGDIIQTFLTTPVYPSRIALLIQKEVAERIARSEKESVLSLSVKAFGKPKYIKTVSRGCFSPPPSVDSAILLIDEISHAAFSDVSEKLFFTIIKAAFSQKRKMLGNSLDGIVDPRALSGARVSPKSRPENISLTQWLKLAAHQATIAREME